MYGPDELKDKSERCQTVKVHGLKIELAQKSNHPVFLEEKPFVNIWPQSSETGGRNYSVKKRPYILFEISITCQNRLFRPSSFISLDHPLTFLGTDWFHPQRPSSFYFSTVHYHSLRSSNFISFGFQDRSLSETVHFESFGRSSMILDQSVGPSSLTTDRSL